MIKTLRKYFTIQNLSKLSSDIVNNCLSCQLYKEYKRDFTTTGKATSNTTNNYISSDIIGPSPHT